ncbi:MULTISPECIES: hypothetical protein [Metabacillus]|uniref:Uncharacterized protein n=2 Tax=Metabacillus TaxID=2675233 RepID=A0ABX6S8E9_9BACI|nr:MULTISPECIES: hypothetical protein [Metabacillus]QNF30375.1 hypothetical protein HUW50_24640 [Metabacillus sp. KUDC1714]
MKSAKGLFILGALIFPIGIYLASYTSIGVLLGIIGGMLIFFSAPSLTL